MKQIWPRNTSHYFTNVCHFFSCSRSKEENHQALKQLTDEDKDAAVWSFENILKGKVIEIKVFLIKVKLQHIFLFIAAPRTFTDFW